MVFTESLELFDTDRVVYIPDFERPVKHIPWKSSCLIQLPLNFFFFFFFFFLLSQTLLLLQFLHPSSVIFSPCASQSPSFVKFCPSSLFLPVHSHLPFPFYYILHQSFMFKLLSFPLSFTYNHSLSILANHLVWKAPMINFINETYQILSQCLSGVIPTAANPLWFELPYSASPVSCNSSTCCQCS